MKKGLAGATGNYYCGLLEFEDMGFLLHSLRKDEIFYDIGANVGSYTILASAVIGARSVSIEPIPTTYENLWLNVAVNNIIDLVKLKNVGVGSQNTNLRFTKEYDCTNHITDSEENNTILVPIITLDELANQEGYPSLIKIDVEGFEYEVLRGGHNTLSTPKLNTIIIELNGLGTRYGYQDDDIHSLLKGYGFNAFSYDPFKRLLVMKDTYNRGGNTIYIKDIIEVIERTKKSPTFSVLNQYI